MERYWVPRESIYDEEDHSGKPRDVEVVLATDAQATVEALQKDVNTLNQLLRDKGLGQGEIDGMAADIDEIVTLRQQVEALQRERDALLLVNETHMKTVMKLSSVVEGQSAALDAEREKVKGLEAHMNRLDKHKAWLLGHCRKLRHDIQFEQRTARDFQDLWRTACDQREAFETKLSQLQALVETIKCELFDRYDGAPDSPTRWMGSLIRDIEIAQALPATPTESGQE